MSKGKIAPSLQAIVKSLSKIVELSPDLLIFFGISLIVFKLSVITSPVVPSPLDVPKTKTPFL